MTISIQDEKKIDDPSSMDLISSSTPSQLAFDFDDYDGPPELWLLHLWLTTV